MADMKVAFTSVRTRSLLPSPLVHGRTYWIEDEGKIIVDWGNGPKEFGGGGASGPGPEGDAFFVGSFKDPEALKFAHSAASLGSYATVLSTNTVWIWNGSAWEDSGNEPLTVEVIDSITSTRSDAALSAAQGKHLGDNIASLDAKVQGIIDGGGTGLVVDAELSKESTNPVQNKVITNAIKTVTGVDVTDPESGVNPDGTPSEGGGGGGGGVVINPDSPIGVYVNEEVAKHNANNSAHGLNAKQWGMLRSLDAFPADEGKHLVIGNRGGVPVLELEEKGGGDDDYGDDYVPIGRANALKPIDFKIPAGRVTFKSPYASAVNLKFIAKGNGKYVVAGSDGQIYVSPDGDEWEFVNKPSASAGTPIHLSFIGDKFVLIYAGLICTSVDGVSWTSKSAGYNGLMCNGDAIVGYKDGDVYVSRNLGESWVKHTAFSSDTIASAACYGKRFVFKSSSGSVVVSDDLEAFITGSGSTDYTYNGLYVDGMGYMLCNSNGYITARSTDGINAASGRVLPAEVKGNVTYLAKIGDIVYASNSNKQIFSVIDGVVVPHKLSNSIICMSSYDDGAVVVASNQVGIMDVSPMTSEGHINVRGTYNIDVPEGGGWLRINVLASGCVDYRFFNIIIGAMHRIKDGDTVTLVIGGFDNSNRNYAQSSSLYVNGEIILDTGGGRYNSSSCYVSPDPSSSAIPDICGLLIPLCTAIPSLQAPRVDITKLLGIDLAIYKTYNSGVADKWIESDESVPACIDGYASLSWL